MGLESGRGGSGPGGERGPSCRLLEDPPPLSTSSSWALSLGAECMFFFECMFLLASSFKASANCSLPKVSSSIQDFIHLPKLFCHWRCSCSFCQRGSWALQRCGQSVGKSPGWPGPYSGYRRAQLAVSRPKRRAETKPGIGGELSVEASLQTLWSWTVWRAE